MKKILFVVNHYPTSSETFITDQIDYFKDKGFIVHVLSHSFSGTIDNKTFFSTNIGRNTMHRLFPAVNILFNKESFLNKLKLLNFFKYGRNAFNQVLLLIGNHFVKHNNYDLIYCHYGNNGKFICQLKAAGIIKANTKVAVHFHGVDLNTKVYNQKFYRVLNRFSDIIIVGSDLAIEHLKQLNIYNKSKVIKVPVSLDVTKFPIRVHENNKIFKIVTIGRLIELKGHFDAIEVIREFKDKDARPLHYSIVGDGPLLETLQNKIDEYKLGDSISLLGAVDHFETLKLLYQADVYLYCGVIDKEGRQEMQGLAIIEAMASSCTVISSSVGGVKEYLTEHNAFLCPPGDINCFVDKLVLAENDKNLALDLKKNARNTAINSFDRDKNYQELIKVFDIT